MTTYVENWFARAEEDLAAADILLAKNGSVNLVCFHAQQAGEKYLKGFLAHHDKHVRKSHDLILLLVECKKVNPSFVELEEAMAYLAKFYIQSRYPDDFIQFSRTEAEQALRFGNLIKDFIQGKIQSEHQ